MADREWHGASFLRGGQHGARHHCEHLRREHPNSDKAGVGGDEGTRTPDPRDANAVLSQLSYIPNRPAASIAKPISAFPN